MEQKRLFVDMDGTLARFHDQVNYLERMFEKDFYRDLKPFENMVEGVRRFILNHPDIEVFILSARVNGEPPYCEEEKDAWMDAHLPEIDKTHRIYTDIGRSKAEYIPGGVTKNDFLLDDYNKGLNLWLYDGGSAIKCHNNINQKGLGAYGGSAGMLWTGDMVHVDDSPDLISAEIASHMGIEYDLSRVVKLAKNITYSEFERNSRLNLNPYRPGCTLYLTKIFSKDGLSDLYEATYTSVDFHKRFSKRFDNPLNAIRWLEGKSEFLEMEMENSMGETLRIPRFLVDALASNLFECRDLKELAPSGVFPVDVADAFEESLEKSRLPIVGRVNYLTNNGQIGESCLFHTSEEMRKEVQASQNCGRPITYKWYVEPQSLQKEFVLETYPDQNAPASFRISRDNLSLAVTACGLDIDDIDTYFNDEYTWDDSLFIWENYAHHIDTIANLVDGFVSRDKVEAEFSETIREFHTSPMGAAIYMLENIRDWATWCNDNAIHAGVLSKALNLLDGPYAPEDTRPRPVKASLTQMISSAQGKQTSGHPSAKQPEFDR